MEKIVECVANFSEGRRTEVVDAICAAIAAVPEVLLLDREMDSDHNRSVITFIGPPDRIGRAAFEACRVAAEQIDLNVHRGEHPRIGATDVIPFVPIRDVTMRECVELAEQTAERIAAELDIPVYLYEEAARLPERRDLAVIRKGEYEGLKSEIATNPARRPDVGEPRLHPTAGATVVGARMPLIAYNVYLDTPDVEIAKKIAKAVRFSSGGLRYVKALGFEIKERNQAQVSMNLTNFEATPLHQAFDLVALQAGHLGAHAKSSEIVGLVPQPALNAAAEAYLRLEKFSADQILENKIARLRGEPSAGVGSFLTQLADSRPTPGGGSVAALATALASALGEMACGVTRRKKGSEQLRLELDTLSSAFAHYRARAQQLIQTDADAFEAVLAAYRMPKANEAERITRLEAVERALLHATHVPLETAQLAIQVLTDLQRLVAICNPNVISDAGVAASQAAAAVRSAGYNVLINAASLNDAPAREQILRDWRKLEADGRRLADEIETEVFKRLQTS